jgi:Transcriptional regulator
MELRHLRYFIAVAETGSLTEAAEKRLYTSQPSLSRQIRDLEKQVGVDLFSRTARGVKLTDAGRVFIDHARLALAQADMAVEAARRAVQPAKPRFAVGFLTGQEMTWLPGVLHNCCDRNCPTSKLPCRAITPPNWHLPSRTENSTWLLCAPNLAMTSTSGSCVRSRWSCCCRVIIR